MNKPRQQQGMTLIEIMVAVTISLILLSGVTTLMVSSKRSYNVQNDAARMQENARYAFDFIGNDLRMAGYFGCTGQTPPPPPGMSGTINSLQAADNGVNNNGVNGSDVLMVSYMDSSQAAFGIEHSADDHTLDNTPLSVDAETAGGTTFNATNSGHIDALDIVIVSDCIGNEAHQVALVTENRITLSSPLSRNFNNGQQSFGAQLHPFVTHRYFIEKAMNPEDGWSLYRDTPISNNNLPDFTATPVTSLETELIQGVESMQLRFGLDSDGNGVPEQYVTANVINAMPVGTWQHVVSVQITLLMVSRERQDAEENVKVFQLDPEDAEYSPKDKRRRADFSATIWLRNNSNG